MLGAQKTIRDTSTQDLQAGFSLLEMLIALAIMSLTSVALFQSIGMMLNVSDRAVSTSEKALESAMANKAVSELIDGLVEDWSPEIGNSFKGQRLSFSGVSSSAIHSSKSENAPFTLSLRGSVVGANSLIYTSNVGSWALDNDLPAGVYFEYLGRENRWHQEWPPFKNTIAGDKDILKQLKILRLPFAIAMSSQTGERIYVYTLGQGQPLPARLDLIRGE